MEIVGALASLSQLGLYTTKIIAGIHNVRTELRDAPREIQRQDEHLLALLSVLQTISEDHSLHTQQVATLIKPLQQQINFLQTLLEIHSGIAKRNFAKRIWKTSIWLKEQPRIQQSFKIIEGEKSNLLVYITGAHGRSLHSISERMDDIIYHGKEENIDKQALLKQTDSPDSACGSLSDNPMSCVAVARGRPNPPLDDPNTRQSPRAQTPKQKTHTGRNPATRGRPSSSTAKLTIGSLKVRGNDNEMGNKWQIGGGSEVSITELSYNGERGKLLNWHTYLEGADVRFGVLDIHNEGGKLLEGLKTGCLPQEEYTSREWVSEVEE